ncbi:hypothetical protein FM119_13295 [Mycetocola reblochoni REB411]|uniref:Uncharacterized protein n=1 Tax=Mycetocola reblochoni REB411 TaxID=1255698 RepID=A0A1R4KED8_9MICO|nr:hypothetical protein FM119_13295 [Mycetocola reblochoni REB411]
MSPDPGHPRPAPPQAVTATTPGCSRGAHIGQGTPETTRPPTTDGNGGEI